MVWRCFALLIQTGFFFSSSSSLSIGCGESGIGESDFPQMNVEGKKEGRRGSCVIMNCNGEEEKGKGGRKKKWEETEKKNNIHHAHVQGHEQRKEREIRKICGER